MDRTELAKTIEILKTQPTDSKGFSFRRTIKTLHDYYEIKPIIEFKKQLTNAKGVGSNGEQGY